MTQRNILGDVKKDELTEARTAKARKLARKLRFVLVILCLTAIWQDKNLAPPVHNGMQTAADMAMGYIENSEALSEVLAAAQKGYAELTSDG